MLKTLGKYGAMALIASMSIVGFVAVDGQKAEALQGSSFNPGMIISDSVFYDSSTMSIAEIQRFLDGKVAECRADSSRPGAKALTWCEVRVTAFAQSSPQVATSVQLAKASRWPLCIKK